MESFLTTVARLIREKELPALMIGGHAVTALGHPRATFDLDLLIPRPSASAWKTELAKLGYAPFAESANFIQLEVKSDFPLPPVDLMLVDPEFSAIVAKHGGETATERIRTEVPERN